MEESRPPCPPEPCPVGRRPDPVCGDDGVTYGSECELDARACSTRTGDRIVRLRHRGPCGMPGGSTEDEGSKDEGGNSIETSDHVEEAKTPEGEDNTADLAEDEKTHPASNGKVEQNIEIPEEEEKDDQVLVTEEKEDDQVLTDEGKEEDEEEEEDCVIFCPAVYSPVCGTDGRTYSNACNLESRACRDKDRVGHLSIRHEGRCEGDVTGLLLQPPPPPQPQRDRKGCGRCPNHLLSPVCGSDGRTYASACALRRARCTAGAAAPLEVEHEGPCRERDGAGGGQGDANIGEDGDGKTGISSVLLRYQRNLIREFLTTYILVHK